MSDETTNWMVTHLLGRALGFLRAVARDALLRQEMEEAGYSSHDQRIGWNLLLAASGFPSRAPRHDPRRDRVLEELEAWDFSASRRVRAALSPTYSVERDLLLEGLPLHTGGAAFVSVALLLDRLFGFERMMRRDGVESRAGLAWAALHERGIDSATLRHVRELVLEMRRLSSSRFPTDSLPFPAEETPLAPLDLTPAEGPALRALRDWYIVWSEAALSVVSDAEALAQLGLRRRAPGRNERSASRAAAFECAVETTWLGAPPPFESSSL